jgi:hypothetical protein
LRERLLAKTKRTLDHHALDLAASNLQRYSACKVSCISSDGLGELRWSTARNVSQDARTLEHWFSLNKHRRRWLIQYSRLSLALQPFENTPKALANSSPRLERQRQPWVINSKARETLKGFGGWRTLSGLERL